MHDGEKLTDIVRAMYGTKVKNLLAIARSGAGTNTIPVGDCAEKGIVVFNTPGANATAVKELAICALLLSCRKIADSIAWAKSIAGEGDAIPKMVEKGKGQFVGPEIQGKTLAVMGLGAIGVLGPRRMDYAKVLATLEGLSGNIENIIHSNKQLNKGEEHGGK